MENKKGLIKKLDAELNLLHSISKSVSKYYDDIVIFKENIKNSYNIESIQDEIKNLGDEHFQLNSGLEQYKQLNYTSWLEKELINTRILVINGIANKKTKIKTNKKRVIQYDMNGSFIKSFESTTEASILTGVSRPGISQAINNKKPQAGGFKWMFEINKENI